MSEVQVSYNKFPNEFPRYLIPFLLPCDYQCLIDYLTYFLILINISVCGFGLTTYKNKLLWLKQIILFISESLEEMH